MNLEAIGREALSKGVLGKAVAQRSDRGLKGGREERGGVSLPLVLRAAHGGGEKGRGMLRVSESE